MSISLSSFFLEEWPGANRSHRSFTLKKRAMRSTKFVFFVCFWQLLLIFPFLCPRAKRSHRSSLCRSFLKSEGSDSISSLFTKKLPWGIALIALNKRVIVSELLPSIFKKERGEWFALFQDWIAISLFNLHKKRAIGSKNHRANSQPCLTVYMSEKGTIVFLVDILCKINL